MSIKELQEDDSTVFNQAESSAYRRAVRSLLSLAVKTAPDFLITGITLEPSSAEPKRAKLMAIKRTFQSLREQSISRSVLISRNGTLFVMDKGANYNGRHR